MKKSLFPILVFAFVFNGSFAQGLPKTQKSSENTYREGQKIDFSSNAELKNDIQDVVNSVAYKLMKCCSSWGGNNIRGIVDWDECYYNKARNTYLIVMQANWTGSFSGTSYWIKGKLKLIYSVNADGNLSDRRVWEKIADSGGFSPGCGQDCTIND